MHDPHPLSRRRFLTRTSALLGTTALASLLDSPRLSSQIEGLISNFERVVDGFLAGLPQDTLVPAIQKTNTTIDVPVADLGLTQSVTSQAR